MANEKRLIDANKFEKLVLNHRADYLFKDDVIYALLKQPTVDAVEVVHGQWRPRPHHKFNSKGKLIKYCDFSYCSECETERPMVPPYNYCPNCGAKMDGDGNG